MTGTDPRLILVIGFVLVLLGVVLPFLMVLRVVQPTWLLSFLSYAMSLVGLFLGAIGAIFYVRRNRKDR